jgi:hypothetical protein
VALPREQIGQVIGTRTANFINLPRQHKRVYPQCLDLRCFGDSAINCMVRNISDTGAMLDVTNAVEVPEQFTLDLPADGQQMSCHVGWRREKRIGVAFD